jgi:hypothetical protein
MKCLGQPNWMPPGLELDSLVVGGPGECQVNSTSPGSTQVVRAHNYSLKSYNIQISSQCQSARLYYPNLMEASPEGKLWQGSFTVPFTLENGGRSASASEELAKVKDLPPAVDQSISVELTAAERGTAGEYVLPEFMIQVDVAD